MAPLSFMTALESALTSAGYVEHPEHPQYALVPQLSENGPYEIHGAWISPDGDQWIYLEQTTVHDADGGATVYPPTLVIENSRGGRVCINTHDMEALASALSGETNFTDDVTKV